MINVSRMKKIIVLFYLLQTCYKVVIGDTSQYVINNNKALHTVDERFLSISIDPGLLFSGITLNYRTIQLAKHLQPAYLRVAGPSTSYLHFIANHTTKLDINQHEILAFSPAMWWTLNEFVQKTNFTPIFALNDADREEWPSLIEMTATMNINCLWQMGFDCSMKTGDEYKIDIIKLQEILDKFPAKKDVWKVVGSDLSKCLPTQYAEMLRFYLDELKDVHAVMWEEENKAKTSTTAAVAAHFITGNPMHKLLSVSRPHIPIWTSSTKLPHPVAFQDAINWAVEIGTAAQNGFNLIFRQVRMQELFSDTPAYWVSVIHKMLMGRTVLDLKSTSLTAHPDNYVFAQCCKNQNMFSVRGAFTVMAINNGTGAHKVSLHFHLNHQMKNAEVQSYILQESKNTKATLLNGEKLAVEQQQQQIRFLPKVRRAKAITHLSLDVPPKSIGFFVFPTARISACINNEDDTNLILAEMHKMQEIDFPEQQQRPVELQPRLYDNKNTMQNSFMQFYNKLQKEIDEDRKFFNNNFQTSSHKYGNTLGSKVERNENITNTLERLINKTADMKKIDLKNLFGRNNDVEQPGHNIEILRDIPKINVNSKNTKNEVNLIKEQLDVVDVDALRSDIKKQQQIKLNFDDALKNKSKSNVELPPDLLDYDLSSGEVLKVLTDRARANVERRLAGLVSSAGTSVFAPKIRTKRGHRIAGKPKRRDINMALLREKTEGGGGGKSGNKWTSRLKDNDLSDFDDDKGIALSRLDALLPKKDSKFTFPTLPPFKPKKSLFSSSGSSFERDAGLPTFDLPSLPTLPPIFPIKNLLPTTTTTTTPFADFINDGFNLDEFEELGEALNTHHGIFDDFAEDFTNAKTYAKPHSHYDLWEYDTKPFQREFTLQDDRNVDKAIDFLENYFNDRDRGASYKSFDDSTSFLRRRRKRDTPSFERRRIGDKPRLFKQKKKIHAAKMKLLKAKLSQRKNAGKLKSLTRRSLFDEVYVPKINFTNKLVKGGYEPQMESLADEWRPEDILRVPRLPNVIRLDNRVAIPVEAMSISRNARSIYDGASSAENEIDGNDIKKLSKPLLINEEDDEEFRTTTTMETHIQQIAHRQRTSNDGETFLDRIFKRIGNIFAGVARNLHDFLHL